METRLRRRNLGLSQSLTFSSSSVTSDKQFRFCSPQFFICALESMPLMPERHREAYWSRCSERESQDCTWHVGVKRRTLWPHTPFRSLARTNCPEAHRGAWGIAAEDQPRSVWLVLLLCIICPQHTHTHTHTSGEAVPCSTPEPLSQRPELSQDQLTQNPSLQAASSQD